MSNCPWYIDPKFFDEVTLRPEGERLIVSNYFIPKVLNIITSMSRGDILGDTCVMNCMVGSNQNYQMQVLFSDPVYLDNISTSTIASKLSIQYALTCLTGIKIDDSVTINIVTSSKGSYDELYYIFQFFKSNYDTQSVLEFKRKLENSEDILIFNKLRNLNLKINLLYVKQESNNLANSLFTFNTVNRGPIATLFDIITFERILIDLSQGTKSFRCNKSDELRILNF